MRQAVQADGSALWPEYWPLEKLLDKREQLGTAIFDLQYQNDPSGMGGNVFRRDWFRYVDNVPPGSRRVGVDLNASSRERADYTAAVEVVEDRDHNLYVVGAWRERLAEGHRAWLTGVGDDGSPASALGPRLLWPVDQLPSGWVGLDQHGPAPRPLTAVNIEATVFQGTFTRELLRWTRLPASAIFPDKDKVSRSRALAARYEAGKVYHLRGGPGIDQLERELVAFPNGEHDDQVDALVYASDVGASEFSFAATRGI